MEYTVWILWSWLLSFNIMLWVFTHVVTWIGSLSLFRLVQSHIAGPHLQNFWFSLLWGWILRIYIFIKHKHSCARNRNEDETNISYYKSQFHSMCLYVQVIVTLIQSTLGGGKKLLSLDPETASWKPFCSLPLSLITVYFSQATVVWPVF